MIVVADTSGIIAALNPQEPEHHRARRALSSAATVVVSPFALLELEHVVTRNHDRRTAHSLNDWILAQASSGRIEIPALSPTDLHRARAVQERYSDLAIDLADATVVVIAERYETHAVLTLDRRDFRAMAPLTDAAAFRVLPDDI